MAQQHRCPLQGEAGGDEPGHQAGGGGCAESHHRRTLAVGGVLSHLVEVGAEQHQGGGQGRAAAQDEGLAPGHRGAAAGGGSGGQGEQGGGRGAGPEGQPAERFPQAPVAQPEGRTLVHVAETAAGQHQGQHHRAAAQRHQGHQAEPHHQGPIGQSRHPVAAAGEVHHRMGLAAGIHAGVGVEHIVGEVLPSQQQHGRQQKQQQLVGPHRQAPSPAPAGRQQHRHHRHRVHRPLDRRLPKAPPVRGRGTGGGQRGVTACDDLGLGHGGEGRRACKDPYI